jgi:hypothetical protein
MITTEYPNIKIMIQKHHEQAITEKNLDNHFPCCVPGFEFGGRRFRLGAWWLGMHERQFMNDTAGLRKQRIKRTELAALWQSGAPDQNQIQAKQEEVNALRDQLQAKHTAFRLPAQKICPQAGMGMGGGAGRGMGKGRGMGMAMGPRGGW